MGLNCKLAFSSNIISKFYLDKNLFEIHFNFQRWALLSFTVCRKEDAFVMLSVMNKKCNEIISNTQIFKEHNLLTKKIFEDWVEFIISKGYSHNIRPSKSPGIVLHNERVSTAEGYMSEVKL